MEDELERLLGLPLEEFTAARTEAVKRLRKEGRTDAAAEVQALRKPTAPVWALNQAARREPGDVRALVRAAEQVRKDPVAGERDFRAALGDVVRNAERALAQAGSDPTEATKRRIGTTAWAAAASAPDELVRGILREELEPTGFEAMAGFAAAQPARRSRRSAPKDDAAARRKRLDEARRAVAAASENARKLGAEATAAERAAAKARAEADRADEAVRRAEQRLADAQDDA